MPLNATIRATALVINICKKQKITKNLPFRSILLHKHQVKVGCSIRKHHHLAMENLNMDNLALRALPLDSVKMNYTRTVPGACFSLVETTPVENPNMIAYSKEALQLLDIPEGEMESDLLLECLSGNKLIPGSQTAAHCYCGHQFGHFSGQLGDGAAIYLGEIINQKGERWELQLKGAGKTPYSRHADGRKVLRSSIREFLCSEAMHYLGVPTTRAGTCITSDSRVVRDVFYDGNPQMEKCTIVSRIAPTFIRFGSFEIFKAQDPQTMRAGPSVGRTDILHKLLDYVIQTFYPEVYEKYSDDSKSCYLEFYKKVVRRTAKLVSLWQCIGFCHGVLNTDNMSIMGITIDYGPYGFMDYFDPKYICNASDNNGRYDYVDQPSICKWNLLKLAEAMKGALSLDESKEALQEIYDDEFKKHYYRKMQQKLGLNLWSEEDEDLVQGLLFTMKETSADFTNTFRLLCEVKVTESDKSDEEVVKRFTDQCQSADDMKKKSHSGIDTQQLEMMIMIAQRNPAVLQQIGVTMEQLQNEVKRAKENMEKSDLTQNEKTQKDSELWSSWIEKYMKRIMKDVQQVKEEDREEWQLNRAKRMKEHNPKFILRNYIAQNAIKAAEEGDFTEVRRVLKILKTPYSDDIPSYLSEEKELCSGNNDSRAEYDQNSSASVTESEFNRYECKSPSWAMDLRVT